MTKLWRREIWRPHRIKPLIFKRKNRKYRWILSTLAIIFSSQVWIIKIPPCQLSKWIWISITSNRVIRRWYHRRRSSLLKPRSLQIRRLLHEFHRCCRPYPFVVARVTFFLISRNKNKEKIFYISNRYLFAWQHFNLCSLPDDHDRQSRRPIAYLRSRNLEDNLDKQRATKSRMGSRRV